VIGWVSHASLAWLVGFHGYGTAWFVSGVTSFTSKESHDAWGGELAHECYVTPLSYDMIKLDVLLLLFVLSVRYGQDWAKYSVTTYIEHQSPSASFHISHWWSMKNNCSGNLYFHWFRKISSIPSFLVLQLWFALLPPVILYKWQNFFFSPVTLVSNQTNSVTLKMETVHFSETMNTFSNCMVQKPKRKPPSG
jgi:hypothetical protein